VLNVKYGDTIPYGWTPYKDDEELLSLLFKYVKLLPLIFWLSRVKVDEIRLVYDFAGIIHSVVSSLNRYLGIW